MNFDNDDRIITPDFTETDHDIEISLRPKSLTEYIGQESKRKFENIY